MKILQLFSFLFYVIGMSCATPTRLMADDASAGFADYPQEIVPLLRQHCLDCHSGDASEANVDLSAMRSEQDVLQRYDLWRRVREALESKHMPPSPQDTDFDATERQQLVHWIRGAVEAVDPDDPRYRHPGPSYVRQLTPYEYMRSVSDLLYLEEIPFGRLGIEQEFPKEGLEFVNQALGLSLSGEQFDRYLRAGDEILKQLFDDDSGVWQKTGATRRRYMKAAEKARPQVLFVQPTKNATESEMVDSTGKVLNRLAERAFRRPLRAGESEQMVDLYRKSRELGGGHDDSLRAAMLSILASPNFLLRVENDRGLEGEAYRIDAHELATRLSYFLWSSIPDDHLRELADTGVLLQANVLNEEVDRMLQHPRADALTDHFASQWLQLRLMDLPSLPDRRGFPDLTKELQRAFRGELLTFFDQMRVEDHPITDFLGCDYTYVDAKLGRFYGIEKSATLPKKGDKMVRVSLKPEQHRGGLLGMAGFLWMTSHENRTKPTARGTWILEVILGTPPPPPPPSAGSFAAPSEGQPVPKNFREKLAQHAQDSACIGCHQKIDPLGFALDNFDPIGAWRDEVEDQPVDNTGQLPSGETFVGFEELRDVILQRQDQFVRNFVSQMMRYALGRELLYTDRGAVERISREVENNGFAFSAVIKGIVASRPFQYRVNHSANAATQPK